MATVRLPDGTIVKNVPEGTTQAELMRRLGRDSPIDEPLVAPNLQTAVSPVAGLSGFRASDPAGGRGDSFLGALRGVGEVGLELGLAVPAMITAGLQGTARGIVPGGLTGPEAVEKSLSGDIGLGPISLPSVFEPRSREGQLISGLKNEALGGAIQLERDIVSSLGDPDDVFGATAASTALEGAAAVFGARNLRPGTPKPLNTKQQVLKEAQAEGYVVPTSSAVPESVVRGAVEGAAGKPRMQQQASFKNQEVTNNLAARELGLAEGTEITLDVLDAVRAEAGQAYKVLDNAGTVTTNVVFRRDLANSIKDLKSASKDFPVLAKADGPVASAIEMAQGLNQPTFNAGSVAAVTRILRDNASEAFRNGQGKVGQAFRDMSKAIEDAAEAHLVKFGDPNAVAAFRDARTQIAKSYSIEKALDGDGFVSATKLKNQRSKREPLTGGLDLAARFAEQFPKSARVFKEAPIQTGRLSSILGAGGIGGSLLAGSPELAAIIGAATFGGPAIRSAMLSRPGQSGLISQPTGTVGVPAAGAGLLTSSNLGQ